MKKIFFSLFLISILSNAQNFERKIFDYNGIKTDTISVCDHSIQERVEESLQNTFTNNSKSGLKLSKEIFTNYKNCPDVYLAYGLGLFRNGDWLEGVKIIEDGINKFGSVESLIRAKSELSLEMAFLGIGEKNIDGNSVFKSNFYPYDETIFKNENFKSALIDYQYLAQQSNLASDYYAVAKILQQLEEYKKSNDILKDLINDLEMGYYAKYAISENYIYMKNFSEAETILNELYALNPNPEILDDLAFVYGEMGLTEKESLYRRKATFYTYIPENSSLKYSDENFDLLEYFVNDKNSADLKLKKLTEIDANNFVDKTIDICLMVLKLHANHGNGVEEKATEILKKYSSKSIDKVNNLFQTDNISTCTISNLAEIMVVEKSQVSWELLKSYLNFIPNMPSTILPPRIPEIMLKFDEDKGLTEILLVVRNLLNQPANDQELNFLGNSDYIFYSALKNVKKSKVLDKAKELRFSTVELKMLNDNLK